MSLVVSRRSALVAGATLPWNAAAADPVRRLTVAAFPAIDAIVRAAVPTWRSRMPAVDVDVVSRQSGDHHTAMITALSTATHLPDVMAVEIGYLGRFAQGRGLQDLRAAPFEADQHRTRFVPYAWTQATNARGEVVALPADIGPGTLLYRHDLLAKAGLDETALIITWDDYVAAGRQIKARTGAYLMSHARDMKDIMIRSGVRPGDGLYFSASNQVLVNSPRFERAFELAREVRRAGLDARVFAWSTDWAEGFRRGAIATQMMGAWLAGHMNSWLAPGTRGLWRAAQLPEASFAAFGGTFFAIPRNIDPARKAAAWVLLQMLTMDRGLQLAAFKSQDAFPALVETFSDPFFDEAIPFLGQQSARTVWRTAAGRIAAPAVNKQDAFADEVINTELDKVLGRGKSIATALADAERLLRQRATR